MKIEVVLDRFEEDKAVLITKEGKEIIMPKQLLGSEINPKESLWLQLSADAAATEKNADLAKNMLNEIISKDEE